MEVIVLVHVYVLHVHALYKCLRAYECTEIKNNIFVYIHMHGNLYGNVYGYDR